MVLWGKQAVKANEKRFLFLTQTFDSIREIKVFKNKDFFVDKYFIPNRDKYRISTLIGTVNASDFSRIRICNCIKFLLIFLNFVDYNTNKIIVIMGLFSIATVRIIPSLNKIFVSYQIIKYGHHATNKLP